MTAGVMAVNKGEIEFTQVGSSDRVLPGPGPGGKALLEQMFVGLSFHALAFNCKKWSSLASAHGIL